MKAILIQADKSLSWQEVPTPVVEAGHIVIRVHATAVNRADLAQRQGFYPPPAGASEILGLECAGEVVAVYDGAYRHKKGDKVCALLAGGGYAEYVSVHETNAMPVPAGLTCHQAAALPEVFATAWLNLFIEASLQPNEKVILHAGASGVGSAAVQLCKAFGSPCFVTVGSDMKRLACIELGAVGGANRHGQTFAEQVAEFAPVDVILDPVGAAYLTDNINLLNTNGRLVIIGLMGGSKAKIDLAALLMKRLKILGSTLRARPVDEKARVLDQLFEQVWPKIAAGEIRPVIDAVMPIREAEQAHALVASDNTIGKVILSVTENGQTGSHG